jgi:hypothetical protein
MLLFHIGGYFMKTEVMMKRELFGEEIYQKSKSEFFSATDLVRAGNKWRISQGMQPFMMSAWLQQRGTKEFIEELNKNFNKVLISGRGRGKHTWVHPYLFIDMALAINPKIKIEVYTWLYDYLLKYRNDSGDSYKVMSGALYEAYGNKRDFPRYIQEVAKKIKQECGVKNWQEATVEQLSLRDSIHTTIFTLSDILTDPDMIVSVGIDKAKKLSKKEIN